MSQFDTLLLSVSGNVATLLMNRPTSRNAFNPQMRHDMLTAIKQVEQDESIRIVIVSGEGESFSAGQDLTEIDPSVTTKDLLEYEYRPIVAGIRDSKKTYISAVNGACAGAAVAIAMSCDLSVMAKDAYYYLAFAALGLIPDAGIMWMLARAIGHRRTFELSVEGGRVDAEKALSLGLVNRIVNKERLLSETQEWAKELSQGSSLAQRYAKEVLRYAGESDFSESFSFEADKQDILYESDYVQKKIRSFLERKNASK